MFLTPKYKVLNAHHNYSCLNLWSYRIAMFWILSLCLSYQSHSQINIKIGYSLSALSAENNNNILQAYNDVKVAEGIDLGRPFADLNIMNGVNIGLRYLIKDTGGFEFSYEGLSSKRRAVGEQISDGSLFQEELFYSLRQFMFGYQSLIGNLGIGTSIGYNNLKIQQEISTSDFKISFLDQNQFTARINISYYLKSNNTVSLAFQPYIQFPLGSYDLNPLEERLELTPVSNYSDSFFSYGLTIVFYNGKQY